MKYINLKETMQLIRKALKEAFPGVRFYVKKDGTSVRVRWVNGPSKPQVQALLGRFSGEGFDGMTDMRYSKHVQDTKTGERATFGTAFIFLERAYSPEVAQQLKATIQEKTGCEGWPFSAPYGWPKSAGEVLVPGASYECRDMQNIVFRVFDSYSEAAPQPSPTASRFEPIKEAP